MLENKVLGDDIFNCYIDGNELIIPKRRETLHLPRVQSLSQGVYLTENMKVYSLYGNKKNVMGEQWWNIDLTKKILKEAKLVTKHGLFHPETRWDIYKLLPGGSRLFSIYSNMPCLDEVKRFKEEDIESIVAERIGHLQERWGVLPLSDAMLERNWGAYHGVMYMVDIDILQDIAQSFYLRE